MKIIKLLTVFVGMFALSVYAAPTSHNAHHSNAKNAMEHTKKLEKQSKAAHIHDHKGNAKAAADHAALHGGSHSSAHVHDHQGHVADAHAHTAHH